MKPRITFELNQSLLEQIQRYSEEHEIPISAVMRQAAKKFTESSKLAEPVVAPVAVAPVAVAPVPDDGVVGPDGYTKAERKALYAEAEAKEKARRIADEWADS